MAGRGAQSFLKRQKEQKRAARAVQKRAAQQARRDRRAAGLADDNVSDELLLGPPDADAAESDNPTTNPPGEGNDAPSEGDDRPGEH